MTRMELSYTVSERQVHKLILCHVYVIGLSIMKFELMSFWTWTSAY